MNWFLYVVTKDFLDEDGELVKKGSKGVGECSMETGIIDAPYGTMYIAPGSYVKEFLKDRGVRNPSAYWVSRAVEFYFHGEEEKEDRNSDEFIFD
jgi:hypothetical protein